MPDDLDRLLLGESPALCALRAELRALARVPFRGLLVLGETGVGKELVPRALHALSPHLGPAYEVFNCPAVPHDHLESELFGTARGAYPGAVDRPGLVERADGGLLFLDEVASLAGPHQAKLLRFLESGEARRLGAARGYRVSPSLVAASQDDLAERVADGRFREDLYYRLVRDAVVRVPPLRERAGDVPLLARAFLAELAHSGRWPVAPGLAPDAVACLRDHAWPGNVRELRAVVVGAARLAPRPELRAADVRAAIAKVSPERTPRPAPMAPARGATNPAAASFHAATRELRRDLLLQALDAARGNQTRAGILLGLHGTPDAEHLDLRARKRAHRRFRYWWERLVEAAETDAPRA